MPKQWANMWYEIWVTRMNRHDPDVQEAAAMFTKQGIAMIIKELVTVLRKPWNLKGMNLFALLSTSC